MDIHHIKCNENQLTSLSGLDSSGAWVTVSYRYDPMGRRISSSLNNQTTLYAYDGWNVVEEYNTASPTTPTKIYTWGIDLSGTTQGAGGVGGVLYTEDLSSGTAWHHHYDGNGNVTHLTDASATSIASYTYDAFGNTETATGSAASANKYRFSTKPIDDTIPTNPLYYYGYRFYNPETGRWLNRDPIEEKGGLNLYGFVGNDGVGNFDCLGYIGMWPTFTRPGAGPPENRKPTKPTGVKVCVNRGFHRYLEYRGGTVGCANDFQWLVCGKQKWFNPDDPWDEPDDVCKEIELNPDEYDTDKFHECIKNQPSGYRGITGDPFTVNCLTGMAALISECMKKSSKQNSVFDTKNY